MDLARGIRRTRLGLGKTALMEALCTVFFVTFNDIWALTTEIYTKEDAANSDAGRRAVPKRAHFGVETGGCPHTAIREDASINLPVAEMCRRFPKLDLILIESGGDNFAATFRPGIADITLYVIDVSGGEKIPRRAGRHHALRTS